MDNSYLNIFWHMPNDDGVNILGTPLGSPEFIESYLFEKRIEQRLLMTFIQEVAATGFRREAVAMLTGAASQRLTQPLKTMQKNPRTVQCMKKIDEAHVSTWIHYLSASAYLEHAIGPHARDQLARLIDLPPLMTVSDCSLPSAPRMKSS